MSTYAEWRLWVGISQDNYLLEELPQTAEAFIDEVMRSFNPVQRDNLAIQSIGMHGETVGIGVVIHELNWETEIGEQNVFDPTIITKAKETQIALNKVFDDVGMHLRANIYNHIDLGD